MWEYNNVGILNLTGRRSRGRRKRGLTTIMPPSDVSNDGEGKQALNGCRSPSRTDRPPGLTSISCSIPALFPNIQPQPSHAVDRRSHNDPATSLERWILDGRDAARGPYIAPDLSKAASNDGRTTDCASRSNAPQAEGNQLEDRSKNGAVAMLQYPLEVECQAADRQLSEAARASLSTEAWAARTNEQGPTSSISSRVQVLPLPTKGDDNKPHSIRSTSGGRLNREGSVSNHEPGSNLSSSCAQGADGPLGSSQPKYVQDESACNYGTDREGPLMRCEDEVRMNRLRLKSLPLTSEIYLSPFALLGLSSRTVSWWCWKKMSRERV